MEKATKVELKDGIIMKTIGLLLKQTELVIYFVMYLDIIKHDKSMVPLIGPTQVKGRIRRSAVSLTALCYTHIFKTIGLFILMYDPTKRSARYTYIVLADCIFAIEATIEAVSVHETRAIFKHTLKKIIPGSFFFNLLSIRRNAVEPANDTKQDMDVSLNLQTRRRGATVIHLAQTGMHIGQLGIH